MRSPKLALLLVFVLLTQPIVSLAMSCAAYDFGKAPDAVSTEAGHWSHDKETNLGVTPGIGSCKDRKY